MNAATAFRFDNSFARELGDAGIAWKPAEASAPRLIYFNRALAAELGLDADSLAADAAAALWAGNVLPDGAQPMAQAYAGHQFGGFSPQLGDGRALLIGELVDTQGRRRDLAFKGSGRTPFSRGGDGKAAVGPMLREVLIGEAMHALGVPTTRALAVAGTGDQVWRDTALPGAVLTRVAASHLRVGTFQFFAARGDRDTLARLADYTIARHDPELVGTPGRHLGLLWGVARRQAALIAQWMNLGFIHGVMNTDNMTISGETIDYGPCAWLEAYDPKAVFSSIDHHGRYAYGNQPHIARWNLARLAEALLPLMVDSPDDEAAVKAAVEQVTEVIDAFPALYAQAWLEGQRAKLGLADPAPAAVADANAADRTLAEDFLALLQEQRVDFTLAWRRLADAAQGQRGPLQAMFGDARALNAWLDRWDLRCAADDSAQPAALDCGARRAARMRAANPRIVPRNQHVENALAAASEQGDLAPFERLLQALGRPFDDGSDEDPFAQPAPAAVTACYKTFCGT